MADSSESFERQVEQTRHRIDRHLDRLSDQLSPAGIISSLLGDDKQSTAGFAASAMKTARENPVSTLLIGAGIAGLFLADQSVSSGKGQNVQNSDDADTDANNRTTDRQAVGTQQLKRQVGNIRDSISKNAGSMAGQASEIADRAAGAVTSASNSVRKQREAFSEGLHSGTERATRTLEEGARKSQDGVAQAMGWVRKNPLPVGLTALAAGAAAAAILTTRHSPPGKKTGSTRNEGEAETRDTATTPDDASANDMAGKKDGGPASGSPTESH